MNAKKTKLRKGTGEIIPVPAAMAPVIAGSAATHVPATPKARVYRTDWQKDLKCTIRKNKQGKEGSRITKACFSNIVAILTNDPRWRDVFVWDEFSNTAHTVKHPPWSDAEAPQTLTIGPVTDDDTARLRCWLDREWFSGTTPRADDVHAAVMLVAHHCVVHPIRDYLLAREGEWIALGRKTSVLDTWVIRLGGAEDNAYNRAVCAKWMLAAVARIFEPGCKVDNILVLHGPQDGRKSTALETLAVRPEWFYDCLNTVTKDGQIGLADVWIVEDAELAGLRRSNERTNKQFISRKVEKYRSPYDKIDSRHPRQCVLAGSVNDAAFLTDVTGNRRYWIVEVKSFDIAKLMAEVPLLWGEATARYHAGEKHYFETGKDQALIAAAAEYAEAHRKVDEWEPLIVAYLEKPSVQATGVSTTELLEDPTALNHTARDIRKSGDDASDTATRVADVLRSLGWTKCKASRFGRGHERVRHGKRVRERVYFSPEKPCAICEGRGRDRGGSTKRAKTLDTLDTAPRSLNKSVSNPHGQALDTPGQWNGRFGKGHRVVAAAPAALPARGLSVVGGAASTTATGARTTPRGPTPRGVRGQS